MSVEALRHRCALEVNVLHDVGLAQAVGADHSLVLELVEDLADLVLDIWGFVDLVDTLKTGFVGDELVDVINDDSKARGVVESARTESGTSLKT